MADIEIRNVSKIFGKDVKTALKMIRDGSDKTEVLAKCGCSVGLNEVSMSIAVRQDLCYHGVVRVGEIDAGSPH